MLGVGEYMVEIYKCIEGEEGGMYFLGISIDDDVVLLVFLGRLICCIEIYGDFIFSGMGNVVFYNGLDNLFCDKNYYFSYGVIVVRMLGVELYIIL